jgi:hypothetical protein
VLTVQQSAAVVLAVVVCGFGLFRDVEILCGVLLLIMFCCSFFLKLKVSKSSSEYFLIFGF